jgi:chromosome segregation ATPase
MGAAAAVKYRYFSSLIFVISVMAIPGVLPLATANAFRWVDENGQVHYGDHLPPQDVDKAYSVINKEGITINSVEKAKTKEQLAEERRLQQQRAQQEKLARERAAYDHILLDTYMKVSDLEETRDRYIATLEGAIKVAQHKLSNLNNDLDKLQRSAANLEREGKPVPEDISKDIANLQTQVERENSFIRAQRTQQNEVREKFADDIKRYKELKSEQQSAK